MGRARRRHQAVRRARPAAPPKPLVPSVATTRPWNLWLCTAALLIATAIALHPALRADFLSWDDTAYVSMNKLLQSTEGLKKIWDPFWATKDQYYPLVFTSYWLEYRLWDANSTGYHAVNLGLHLTNIVLVTLLIRALGGSGWVVIATASVFALHPLQVASVAWIAERKNLLSGVFYLFAFLAYLHHRRTNRWGSYGGCLLAFIAALLSKTQTVTLPASLLLVEYLLPSPARLRPVQPMAVARRIAPMLALGVVAALVTAHVEHENVEWSQMP